MDKRAAFISRRIDGSSQILRSSPAAVRLQAGHVYIPSAESAGPVADKIQFFFIRGKTGLTVPVTTIYRRPDVTGGTPAPGSLYGKINVAASQPIRTITNGKHQHLPILRNSDCAH